MKNNKLEAALKYLAMGLSIIPASEDKIPLIKWQEYQNRFPTHEEICSWWSTYPLANIALVTGKLSGIIALDIDVKHNRSSKEFNIPVTACAKSGSGGEHFYFKYPDFHVENKTAISGLGVDIRGDGGIILIAPSINTNGSYEWLIPLEDGLADVPDWLIKLIKKESDPKWLSGKNGVQEGTRNDTATSFAGKLLSYTPPEVWEEIGWQSFCVWNQKNTPPLSEKELRSVWESIKKKHDTGKIKSVQKYNFTTLKDLLDEPEEIISWIVEGILPTGGFSMVVAKPKVGKSTLVRQLALAVAQGEPFLERQTAKGKVLYIALEEKRSEVRSHFKLLGADGTENLSVFVGFVPEEAVMWLESEVRNERPVLIIIDTLFRFAKVSDVSDYAKVTNALNPLLKLSRENDTHLMVLHHARKNPGDGADTTLGSTAIFGSVDTAIMLKLGKNQIRTIETIQRYGLNIEETILHFDSEMKTASLGGPKEEEDKKLIREIILDYLKARNESVTEKDIQNDVPGKNQYKVSELRELVKLKLVYKSGTGGKGHPYLYSCSSIPNPTSEHGNNDKLELQ